MNARLFTGIFLGAAFGIGWMGAYFITEQFIALGLATSFIIGIISWYAILDGWNKT